jgi:hypothetical protein
MNALAQMEVEILLKRTAIFSCTGKATKGSSCKDLEKKQFLKKITTNSWISSPKVVFFVGRGKLNLCFERDYGENRGFLNLCFVWCFAGLCKIIAILLVLLRFC